MKKSGFSQWLMKYKEYSATKAANIISRLNCLSDDVCMDGADTHIFTNDSYSAFVKWRIHANNKRDFSNSEKKDLDLLSDYFQMRELAHVDYDIIEKSALEVYCETMKMSYSYKPVLILAIVCMHEKGKPGSYNDVIDYFISYYKKRLNEGSIAEKEESIFANEIKDLQVARGVIENNPVKVLKQAGVITCNPEKNYIDVTSEYTFEIEDIVGIKEACEARLIAYYGELCTAKKNEVNSFEKLRSLLGKIEQVELKEQCLDVLDDLQKEFKQAEGNETSEKDLAYLKISTSDDRKIGKLVRETMAKLSECGFEFSDEDLQKCTNKEWSKKELGLYYPMLKLYKTGEPLKMQTQDHLGNSRYYGQTYLFGTEELLITSEWYKESKDKYIKWFNGLIANK